MNHLCVFLLVLITTLCSAQPRLTRYYHAMHDTCPDPLKNHIRQRTIYTRCGDVGWCREDTTIEKFDRQGRLISIEKHSTDSYGNRLLHHDFTYDSLGRTVRDTGIYDEKTAFFPEGYLVEYEYPDRYTAIERVFYLGKKIVTTRQYNKDYVLTHLLTIENGRDTVQHIYTRGDTTITLTWANFLRLTTPDAFTLDDSSITIKTKDLYYTYSSKADGAHWQPVATLIRYDSEGRMIYKLRYHHGNILADSIVPTYNDKNQLIKETWYGRSENGEKHIRYHIQYTYNKNQLIESREWEEHHPDQLSIRRFAYNRKGLRTKWEFIWTNEEGKQEVHMTEVWEFEY